MSQSQRTLRSMARGILSSKLLHGVFILLELFAIATIVCPFALVFSFFPSLASLYSHAPPCYVHTRTHSMQSSSSFVAITVIVYSSFFFLSISSILLHFVSRAPWPMHSQLSHCIIILLELFAIAVIVVHLICLLLFPLLLCFFVLHLFPSHTHYTLYLLGLSSFLCVDLFEMVLEARGNIDGQQTTTTSLFPLLASIELFLRSVTV